MALVQSSDMSAPKLFISYSWTTPEHEARVLELATELRESGVDVILDKWDLKEGHDAHAFMEKMVTDPDVKKVLLICDRVYAEKTDGRKGGVGTEAQIITGEIYKSQVQDKFVAVVMERDADGKAYLPVYYRSRIYIDFTDPSAYSENFEQLLRWIFNKPLYRKPELGKPPGFLSTKDGAATLATSSRFKRAIDAVRGNKPHAIPAVAEYFDMLAEQLEALRLPPASDPFDDAVLASIESFVPYRNEAIELFLGIACYLDTPESRERIHRFFENLIPYLDRSGRGGSSASDNFRFIIHELFLYAIACQLRYERFEAVSHLLNAEYYFPEQADFGRAEMVSFTVFQKPVQSLSRRNLRLNLQRQSVHADLLKARCTGVPVQFRQLIQAEFVVYLWASLHRAGTWWPVTLLYVSDHGDTGAFELFARSKSQRYFDSVRGMLGIASKDELERLLDKFESNEIHLPRWQSYTIDPRSLLGFDALATKP